MSIQTQCELPLEEAIVDDDSASAESTLRLQQEQVIINKALAILSARHQRGALLSDPESTKQFLRIRLAEQFNEVFGCVFLDNRHRIITIEDLFFGTVNGASIHPRVIVQRALFVNAAALLAYHNHPSGVAEPSQSDRQITKRIQEALKYIDVQLLDHFIVGIDECTSFAQRGLL
jgi:DNA repair protein RadC